MVSRLLARMADRGDTDAMVHRNRTYSYRDILELVDEWRLFLDSHRVGQGQVVTLEGDCSPQAVAGLLALAERAAIVVPLRAPTDLKREEYLTVAEAEVTVGVGADGGLRAARTGRTARHALYARLRDEGRAGLVLFSSGTTGRSKGSVLDVGRMLGRYQAGGIARRIVSFLSLDHIGGLNTVWHTLSTGGTLISVPERAPDTVFSAVADHRAEVLPTTPTFLNMALIADVARRYETPSLRLITYGTEPMPQSTLERLRRDFPHVRLKQTYGLSELGILPTRSRSDGELWLKLGGQGFAYKIVDDVLWIRSEMAMLGYLNAPAPFDDEGFFNTQDVVVCDEEWVRVLGRRSEIINVGGEKVYPSEVENVLLEMPGIAEATVSGRPSPVTGMVVKATVLLTREEDERTVARRVREHCGKRLEPFKVPAVVEVSTARQYSDRFKKIRGAAS